ncbi:MAG TPA: hypothetical protein VK427_04340 [Kofleriaceae bacterium]|nr:hypothetical protein [Kofleriaceae bacterium]
MRMVASVLVALVGVADAQPGATPPYAPPPQQYQPVHGHAQTLTPEEHDLLMQGEISDGAHLGGGVAAVFLGFGTGQAIQGRWSDTGWIFTLGESASLVALIAGAARAWDDCANEFDSSVDCDHSDGPPLMLVGGLGLVVFRVWEIVDAFGGPATHNRRVRALQFRMGMPVRVGAEPFVGKTRDGGMTAGLTLRF